jgi:hypothetical protein
MAGSEGAGNAKKFLPIALVVVGVAVIVVGILGTVNDWGATETTTVATKDVPTTVDLGPARTETSSGATSTPPTEVSGTTDDVATTVASTTEASVETPQEFLTMLGDGLALGGNEFMVSRLHPAVIERYGEEQCRQSMVKTPDPAARFDIISVSDPAPYAWATDGLSTDIPDTLTVGVTRTSSQGATDVAIHITPVDGEFRWFTDCGDPLPPG